MLKYLYLASFVQICCGQAVTTIDASLPQHVELDSTQRISCDIAGTLKTGVQWIRPDTVLVSSCAGATNCLPNSGYSNPVATTTRNVLEIANLTASDAGSWTCRDGTDGQSSRKTIIVMKTSSACVINSTSSLDSLKEGSQVTIMVYIKQYYCSSPSLFQLGNGNVTLSRTPTGLDDNEGNVTISVTQTETLDLYMVCGGVRFKQNCDVTITLETTTLPTTTMNNTSETTTLPTTTMNNTSDISTPSTEGPRPTPSPGICKDNLCYLFFLLLLLLIPIGVLVWCCTKEMREKNSNDINLA